MNGIELLVLLIPAILGALVLLSGLSYWQLGRFGLLWQLYTNIGAYCIGAFFGGLDILINGRLRQCSCCGEKEHLNPNGLCEPCNTYLLFDSIRNEPFSKCPGRYIATDRERV